MRMRVLAAEDDLRRDEVAVLVEHLEVMCDGHEMDLRRQQLVIRMIPPVGREDAELAALDDGLDCGVAAGNAWSYASVTDVPGALNGSL